MSCALQGLAALHPRDEIEVMLGVQAMCAYHAAAACWRLGMNARHPRGDNVRHFNAAGTAARTFDTLLKALERRQAKPLSPPVGRPAPRDWEADNPTAVMTGWGGRCGNVPGEPEPPPDVVWTPEDLAAADELLEQDRIARENEGLDIANTEGILPGGGMILPENPTPRQAAYIDRRLALMYKREIEENRRNGITKYPKIRPIRTGDLIP